MERGQAPNTAHKTAPRTPHCQPQIPALAAVICVRQKIPLTADPVVLFETFVTRVFIARSMLPRWLRRIVWEARMVLFFIFVGPRLRNTISQSDVSISAPSTPLTQSILARTTGKHKFLTNRGRSEATSHVSRSQLEQSETRP